ncbi:MAG TPA: hypothetical protein VKH81_12330 [Candidatus Angelobacter sp.]|nr:hypothetical protein [Candidatus Angelobacter sp.]
MAAHKRTRSRKRHTSRFLYFREVRGKIVEQVEVDPDLQAITILFEDRTALSFDLDPGITVYPELSDWRSGDWRGIKRWPALRSKPDTVEWP